jgi:hypothetical protein
LEHRAEGLRNGVLRPCPFTALDVSIPYAEGFVGKKLSSTSNADGCVTDGMEVVVQLYDGQPFSAKVPARVTCSVIEAEPYFKGQTATPTYKRVVLENGQQVMAPSFITAGDRIVIETADNSYVTRAKD